VCTLLMLVSASPSSISDITGGGKGVASALNPTSTPGERLTGGGDTAATCSVSSFSSSGSEDSVELDVCDSISAVGCLFDPLKGSLSPATSALGFLSDRLTIG